MGVTVNENHVRITRAWGKEEHQIYLSLKQNGNFVSGRQKDQLLREAYRIDKRLKNAQNAYKLRMGTSECRFFHSDGRAVGIRERIRERKGRKTAHLFEVRTLPSGDAKPKFKTISIDRHGYEKAFAKAVEWVSDENGIDRFSPVRKKMLEAIEAHRNFDGESHAPESQKVTTHKIVIDDWSQIEARLATELSEFESKKQVIRGN